MEKGTTIDYSAHVYMDMSCISIHIHNEVRQVTMSIVFIRASGSRVCCGSLENKSNPKQKRRRVRAMQPSATRAETSPFLFQY